MVSTLTLSVAMLATHATDIRAAVEDSPSAAALSALGGESVDPLVLRDLDGPLRFDNKVVFHIEDGDGASAAGLVATARSGWHALSVAELAADSRKAEAASRLANYWAPAFVDRLGGLAWPDRAMFIGFDSGADERTRRDVIVRTGGQPNVYSAFPDLVLVRLDVPSGLEVLRLVEVVREIRGVAFAEPDLAITGRSALIPKDPLFSSSWAHLNTGQWGGLPGFDLRSTSAWELGTGSTDVAVLIIDTGVESSHPDLLTSPGRDFTTGAVDGNPGGDPVNGFENHGTAVAGCVSGRLNNELGTCGIAPLCPSVSARCFVATSSDGSWTANYSWTANALNWALSNGILITNNSNYYGASSAAVASAYAAARLAGAIHMASAGNSGDTSVSYPASLSSVLAVGAAHPGGVRAGFSCYGPLLDFLAPGDSILSTDRTGSSGYSSSDHAFVAGTSFAAPFAAGVAALMRSHNPDLTPDDVDLILASTARDLGVGGYDFDSGWGLLDAAAAVAVAAAICQVDLDGNGTVDGGDLGILLLDWGSGSARSDIDGNGIVDGADVGLLLLAWGPCGG